MGNQSKANFTELKIDMNEKYSSRLRDTNDSNKTIYKVFDKELIDEVLDKVIIHNKLKHNELKVTVQNKIRDRIGMDVFSFKEMLLRIYLVLF